MTMPSPLAVLTAGVTLSLAVLNPAVAAQPGAGDLRYTYVEGGYLNVDVESFNEDGDGLFLGGSVLVADPIYLVANYDYADFDRGIDARTLDLGVGVRLPAAPNVDVVLEGGYVDAEVETNFGDFDDDGYFAAGGARWMVNSQVELNGGLRYVDLDESGDDLAVQVGGLVSVLPNLAVLADIEFADDADSISIGFRYYFN